MDRQQFESMNPDKLLDKIQELNKRLFKMNTHSPMYAQMRGIIAEAQAVYQEHLAMERYRIEKEEQSSVIDIGTIESEVYTPDYRDSNTVSIDSIAQSYTGDKK